MGDKLPIWATKDNIMLIGDREVVKEIEKTNNLLIELINLQKETNHLITRLGATIAQKG